MSQAISIEEAVLDKLRALPPAQQQEVLAFVKTLARDDGQTANDSRHDDALIARYIDTVNVDHDHPSYARLAGHGTPVWAVIGAWKASGDVEDVAKEWGVPVEYVQAALAYYRRYRRYIDAMLVLNESEPPDPGPVRP